MNGALSTTSDRSTGERPRLAHERPIADDDRRDSPAGAVVRAGEIKRSTLLLRHTPIVVILLFFTTQFSTMTLSRFLRVPDESWDNVLPRAFVTVCGILFALLILKVLRDARRASLLKRIGIAAAMAVAGALFHAASNMAIFSIFLGAGDSTLIEHVLSLPLSALDWLWFYSAISVMLLALTYASDLAESDDRIAALQTQAHAAQLKALRYQLNPHFLFNTLNSIAALIGRRKSVEAEAMVVSLSDFLRSTLAMGAGKEITLGDEVALQSLYLEIEKTRFPARLSVTIDVADDIRAALVPNLITQPLIENAIKYAVARSSEPVHLEVIGRAEQGRLSLEIRDDGGNAEGAAPPGTRVGLRNVADRLRLHFGDEATLVTGPLPGGGYSARILMPFKQG